MAIDVDVVADIFTRLGDALEQSVTLCLIGSTPGIANGQPDRQTPDIDVWYSRSDYDTGDLHRACTRSGLLFDPKGEISPDAAYIQIVRPGIVQLPAEFETETIGRFGKLTVVMPPPEVIVAAKLVRGSDVDLQDVVWWIAQRGIDDRRIEDAIENLPNPHDRESAQGNMVLVRLVMNGTGYGTQPS
jgi:hypothetical protein